ncbi:protein TSSC4 [Lutzomyia longipalpis]|uniref:protein TSSC4 n=1 Tax=Lutzomyia longipalpis TaxID=7200 RepID=UPI002484636F|nr:protein TSSC4 [Lutzomyia longipalpis]
MESSEGSQGSQFEDRRKRLFDSLNTAEKSIKGTSLEQSDSSERNRHFLDRPKVDKKTETRHVMKFRGRESIFKRPEAPISQCLRPRRRPDYQVNPGKWTKYSLDDVDTSEHTNTAAAFAFLAECEQRRRDEKAPGDEMEVEGESAEKVVFKKSTKLRRAVEEAQKDCSTSSEDQSPKFRASKVVMPEYVIGQATVKKDRKKKPQKSAERGKELKLDHLFEDEEDG